MGKNHASQYANFGSLRLNAAISYSPIQASGKSIGLAVKLGPLFVGTDYMFFGGNSKSVNGFLGISFPLGGKAKPFSEL